jgi:hypothetical protein
MSNIGRFSRTVSCLIIGLSSVCIFADESCRVAFDMGSSGIRGGTSNSDRTTSNHIDFLKLLHNQDGITQLAEPTIDTLRDLLEKGKFGANCDRIGGGFSVWRLASSKDSAMLALLLDRIEIATGVAVLVIPQSKEGTYAYFGARQLLGDNLATSHVLDIGGGSLQIAGEHTSSGEMLGQKLWHARLCQSIRNEDEINCKLQPLSAEELTIARTMLQTLLEPLVKSLPERMTLTAVSRPVTRGVKPAVDRQIAQKSKMLQRVRLTAAINQLAGLSVEEVALRLDDTAPIHTEYLLSDMLLVEGILDATGLESMNVEDINLTNVPGLLSDDHAYAWRRHYACYLARLRSLGEGAFESDTANCHE